MTSMRRSQADATCGRLREALTRANIELPSLAARADDPRGGVALGECSLEAAERLVELLRGTRLAAPDVGTLVVDEETDTLGVVDEHVAYLSLRFPDGQGGTRPASPGGVRAVEWEEGP